MCTAASRCIAHCSSSQQASNSWIRSPDGTTSAPQERAEIVTVGGDNRPVSGFCPLRRVECAVDAHYVFPKVCSECFDFWAKVKIAVAQMYEQQPARAQMLEVHFECL